MASFTVEIPDELVQRFQAVTRDEMSIEAAIVRVVKVTIMEWETRGFASAAEKTLEQQVRARRAALIEELGL